MKRTASIFLLILISILFIQCNKQEDRLISDTLFNIKNLNNIYVDSFEDENLKKQGYTREVADVLIYDKKVNDTIVQLQFSEGLTLYKTWYITLNDSTYIKNINTILYNHHIIGVTQQSENEKNGKLPYSFPVVDKNNNIFVCYVYEEENKKFLQVVYHVPNNEN